MKYRKKPVVIEAFQITSNSRYNNKWPAWLNAAWRKESHECGAVSRAPHSDELLVNTLEGTHRVSLNDWIIQGVKGELYPCKPDIFEMTYDREDSPTPAEHPLAGLLGECQKMLDKIPRKIGFAESLIPDANPGKVTFSEWGDVFIQELGHLKTRIRAALAATEVE